MLSIDGKILEIYNMVEHFQPVYSLHCTQIAAFTHTHKNEQTHTHSRRLETDNQFCDGDKNEKQQQQKH